MISENLSLDLTKQDKENCIPVSSPLQIEPIFPVVESESFSFFLASMEQLIETIIPESIKEPLFFHQDKTMIRKSFVRLSKLLPLFKHSCLDKAPTTITISSLTSFDFMEGVAGYISDMLSRWLVPGKQLTLAGHRSLSFRFISYPNQDFSLHEFLIPIESEEDIKVIKNNISSLLSELRITILAVYYARYIVSIQSLSLEQKTTMIQDNIATLINRPAQIKEGSVFDQMQQFLLKLSAEEKFHQVKKNITYLHQSRPKTFDKDLFYEVRYFINVFKEKFTASRDPRHVSRVIAFQYLFKKTIHSQILKEPHERHLSFKLLKTHIHHQPTSKKVLGILITMNFLKETERFDQKHILDAIRALVGNVSYIEGSYIYEHSNEKVRSFYLEIELYPLSFEHLKLLKKHLRKELKDRIENVVHHTFMPRNEEEIMKNIIILHKQLRFAKDLPQAIITYDKQLDDNISFQVILVRVLREESTTLQKELEKHHFSFMIDEVKPLGYLKRKHPKEAITFRMFLDKTPFFRKDFSLDIHKARNQVVRNLKKAIGDFRDYNGGMIDKQNEALESLRFSLKEEGKDNEFLIENFFYAIRPGFMQSILSTAILHRLFTMFLHSMENHTDDRSHIIEKAQIDRQFLVMISTSKEAIITELLEKLGRLPLSSGDLVTCTLNSYEMFSLGIVFRENGHFSLKRFELFLSEISPSHST
jgi:hypothetical protein